MKKRATAKRTTKDLELPRPGGFAGQRQAAKRADNVRGGTSDSEANSEKIKR